MSSTPCYCRSMGGVEHQRGVPCCVHSKADYFPGDDAVRDMLIQMRKEGRTQKDVARAIGITPQHLSRIFNGVTDPSFQVARRLWQEIMWKRYVS